MTAADDANVERLRAAIAPFNTGYNDGSSMGPYPDVG
jgi:hypothetical protein